MTKTSKFKRSNQLFLRNNFPTKGKYDMPLVKKQDINLDNSVLIAYSNIKPQGTIFDKNLGVHFFIDDYRFNAIYDYPERSFNKISRYGFALTPDYSLYADIPIAIQIKNVFKSRGCGAYWQSRGLTVIPTISWSLARSFDFCFDGVEKGSIVAVSTLGCRSNAKLNFMRGYEKMLEVINPKVVICYGKTFKEMDFINNIIEVPYYRYKEVA